MRIIYTVDGSFFKFFCLPLAIIVNSDFISCRWLNDLSHYCREMNEKIKKKVDARDMNSNRKDTAISCQAPSLFYSCSPSSVQCRPLWTVTRRMRSTETWDRTCRQKHFVRICWAYTSYWSSGHCYRISLRPLWTRLTSANSFI